MIGKNKINFMAHSDNTTLNKKLCILILIGLPASGKSTFAKTIEPILLENQISIEIISYDEYYAKLIQNNRVNNSNNIFDPQLWHESRRQCFESVENITQNFNDEKPKIIIIDDNMQYRSMRYPFFQLARKNNIGFVEIFFDCELQLAIERNSKRTNNELVPLKTIEQMHKKIERPDPDHYKWEKHSIFVNAHESIDFKSVTNTIIEYWKDHLPPIPIINIEENQRKKEENEQNLFHQMDLRLRKSISILITKHPNISGKQFSKMKKEFLEELKHRAFIESILSDDELMSLSGSISAEQLTLILVKIERHFLQEYNLSE